MWNLQLCVCSNGVIEKQNYLYTGKLSIWIKMLSSQSPVHHVCNNILHVVHFLKEDVVFLYVTGFVKKVLIHAIINIQKYNFEIFNSIYLNNNWTWLDVFIHKSIAIQSNSLYLLYTRQLAGFPTILDSFSLAQSVPLALLQGGRVGVNGEPRSGRQKLRLH